MAISYARKKGLTIPKSLERPNPDGGGVQTVFSIDNRRSRQFTSILHTPTDVTSANKLWEKLQAKIRAAKQYLDFDSERYRFYDRDCRSMFNTNSGAYRNIYPIQYLGDYEWNKGIRPYDYKKEFISIDYNDEIIWEISRYFTEHFNKNSNLSDNISDDKEELESESEFHERSRYRFVPRNNNLPDGWEELQQSLKPSLIDEDCLGGFGDWVQNTPSNVRFLLIGDTNHGNHDLRDWRMSGDYFTDLKSKGFEDLVLEWPLSINQILQDYFDGIISGRNSLQDNILSLNLGEKNLSKKHINDIVKLAEKAKISGIRLHALDEHVSSGLDFSGIRGLYERLSHDSRLADRIQNSTGGRKTAIIYGATHFSYEGTLIEKLGEDNCRTIHVYSDLEDLKTSETMRRRNAQYASPYAFLIKEETVIATKGSYQRDISPNSDRFVASMKMGIQETEFDKFMSKVKETYGRIDSPDLYGVNPVFMMFETYWSNRAAAAGFTKIDKYMK